MLLLQAALEELPMKLTSIMELRAPLMDLLQTHLALTSKTGYV
jgi:hypothetical protein